MERGRSRIRRGFLDQCGEFGFDLFIKSGSGRSQVSKQEMANNEMEKRDNRRDINYKVWELERREGQSQSEEGDRKCRQKIEKQ